ncbi:hypothetical protein [Cohnella caldifontis]|uniref:hypothetical protein n=1 Tax=Cohnella caldifontis TaxID=3027471 RepID=UPI0023EDBFCF|nr:hypothetical protein [Cohnella sp. YIM B05605]
MFITMAAGAINVNALNRGSAVAVGEIAQPGWIEIRRQRGDRVLTNVFDNDLLDNPITEAQPSTSLQNQSL